MKTTSWITKNRYMASSRKWDVILLPTLFVFNTFTFSSWLQLTHVASKPWLPLIWLYGLLGLIPLIWRDKAPLTVFVIQCALTTAAWPIMPSYVPAVAIPVAVYAVSANRGRRASLVVLLASCVPIALCSVVAFRVPWDTPRQQLGSFVGNVVFLTLMTLAAWCAGRVMQASQRHVQNLERERRTAEEAVRTERRRIARDLHDIVSHAVAIVVLQAAGATRVADTNLAQVKQSLAHIETTGRQAMAELQRMLGVLDIGEPASHVGGSGELGPQPGLGDLPALLTSLRAAGMPVSIDVEGSPRDLDPSVDLAAYRIIQEGLTNALKHAGKDTNPQLRLVWDVHHLIIQIDNAVHPLGARRDRELSGGRGLVGLRERAHAVGGVLHAGPHYDDRYRLIATLPVPDDRNGPAQVATLALAGAGGDQ